MSETKIQKIFDSILLETEFTKNNLEKLGDHIFEDNNGNIFAVTDKEKTVALKVLMTLHLSMIYEKYANRGQDYLHSVNESISLLLNDKDYEDWMNAEWRLNKKCLR
jgi:hypothetical protein